MASTGYFLAYLVFTRGRALVEVSFAVFSADRLTLRVANALLSFFARAFPPTLQFLKQFKFIFCFSLNFGMLHRVSLAFGAEAEKLTLVPIRFSVVSADLVLIVGAFAPIYKSIGR